MPFASIGLAAALFAGPPVEPEGPAAPPPRGNTALSRKQRVPGPMVSASLRMAILAGSSLDFMQPVGFGFSLAFRGNLIKAGPARLGLGVVAGYNRWGQRLGFTDPSDPTGQNQLFRSATLSTFDFNGVAHLEVIAGPVIPMIEFGGGLSVGRFVRPLSTEFNDEQSLTSFDPMIRGGLSLAIPIIDNHGIMIGGHVQQIFSGNRLALDPEDEESEERVVFDLAFEVALSYQGWF